MNYKGLSRQSNPGNEVFFILDTLPFLRFGVIMWLDSEFEGRVCPSFRLLHIILPALLSNSMFFLSTVAFFSSCHHCQISSLASLYCTLTTLFFHFVYLSITYLSWWHWNLQCATVFILLKHLSLQIFITMSVGLVQGFWFLKHHKYWTTAKTGLRHPESRCSCSRKSRGRYCVSS